MADFRDFRGFRCMTRLPGSAERGVGFCGSTIMRTFGILDFLCGDDAEKMVITPGDNATRVIVIH